MKQLLLYHFYENYQIWLKIDDKIITVHGQERKISEQFYPIVDQLLFDSNIGYQDLDRITFLNGPGSFTSLRFFLTFIKAFSVSFPSVELIPLNLLELIGFSQEGVHDVLLGGTRRFDRFCHHAKYRKEGNIFQELSPPTLIDQDQMEALNTPLFLGVPPEFPITPYHVKIEDLIQLGEWQLSHREPQSIETLTPYYLKSFQHR